MNAPKSKDAIKEKKAAQKAKELVCFLNSFFLQLFPFSLASYLCVFLFLSAPSAMRLQRPKPRLAKNRHGHHDDTTTIDRCCAKSVAAYDCSIRKSTWSDESSAVFIVAIV